MARHEGEQIGNYKLIRLLRVNGFSEVYLGEHKLLRTQAAIKIPHQLLSDHQNLFINELKILSSLSHPHIIRLLDANINDTVPYLVMEYAPNGTLAEKHPRGTALPLPTVISYVKQIASALQYIHDKEVIHRDVKPNAILLGRNEEILLNDFEIALDMAPLKYQTTKIALAGTAYYMAPEQFEGKVNFAIDQYALGIVAYEWLSGEVPFQGEFIQIAFQHKIVVPPSLREQNPSIPQAVEDVIMKALSKKPEDRFENVTAFADAFERAAAEKRADGIGEQFGKYITIQLLEVGGIIEKTYLGRGMSELNVFKGPVAIKTLHGWQTRKFSENAPKLQRLLHPNILRTLDYGEKEHLFYLIMDYASRGNLLDLHPRGTILPPKTIVPYVKQIAGALQYAYNAHYTYLFVCPKNIFVGKNDEILLGGFEYQLVDWEADRITTQDDVYMMTYGAPEFAKGGKAASTSDQYSLAIMVYEWLCGHVPFQGKSDNLVGIAFQHIRVTPPSLREKNPAIPHEVEEVVMKVLAKDPEKRYESIQDFADALEEAIAPPQANKFTLPDRSGEQFGQYRLERLLGIGGFAEVYLGKHVKLDTFAAIKVLHTRLSVKELESFDKEAKVIASLRHPSIVRVLDYDAQGNIPFLIMDHAPEGTMRLFHARGSRLSLPTVVKYVN